MKIASLLTTLITTTGFALLLAPYASAATVYGSGPKYPDDDFSKTIDAELAGITTSFQLNIFGLEASAGLNSISGFIKASNEADGLDIQNFVIDLNNIVDGTFSLDINGEFLGRQRKGDYTLVLDVNEPKEFDFTFWNVVLGTTAGTEACDVFHGELEGGGTWLHEDCYNPQELVQVMYGEDESEAATRFVEVTSSSGVLVAGEKVIAYRNPENTRNITEGSRTYRPPTTVTSNYTSDSTVVEVEFGYGSEDCKLADTEGNLKPIEDTCRGEDEKLSAFTGKITYDKNDDGHIDYEFSIASAKGETVGFPAAVPEPSLVLGMLSVLGIAGRTALRRSK